jgi:hypothetical protein
MGVAIVVRGLFVLRTDRRHTSLSPLHFRSHFIQGYHWHRRGPCAPTAIHELYPDEDTNNAHNAIAATRPYKPPSHRSNQAPPRVAASPPTRYTCPAPSTAEEGSHRHLGDQGGPALAWHSLFGCNPFRFTCTAFLQLQVHCRCDIRAMECRVVYSSPVPATTSSAPAESGTLFFAVFELCP